MSSGSNDVIDLSSDVSFQAAHDLSFGFTFGLSALDIGLGSGIHSHAAKHDNVQGAVSLSIAAAIEPVALRLPA